MKTIKKSQLVEVFKSSRLDEDVIDAIIKILAKRKLGKKRNKVRDEFIEFYGSYDAIPDSVKKVIER